MTMLILQIFAVVKKLQQLLRKHWKVRNIWLAIYLQVFATFKQVCLIGNELVVQMSINYRKKSRGLRASYGAHYPKNFLDMSRLHRGDYIEVISDFLDFHLDGHNAINTAVNRKEQVIPNLLSRASYALKSKSGVLKTKWILSDVMLLIRQILHSPHGS